MSGPSYLLSSILMGAFFLATVAVFLRLKDWNRTSPINSSKFNLNFTEFLPYMRLILFSTLVLGISAFTIVFLSSPSFDFDAQTSVMIFLALFSLLLFSYLLSGLYASMRSRGGSHAWALAMITITFATLILVVIVIQLILSWGGGFYLNKRHNYFF